MSPRDDDDSPEYFPSDEDTASKPGKQKWYRNKTAGVVFDHIANGIFVLNIANTIIGKFVPFAKFITTPIDGCLRIAAFSSNRIALVFNPNIDLETNKYKRYFLQHTKWFQKGAAYFGCASGVAVLAGVIFPGIAPIAFCVAAGCMVISNACAAAGDVAELINIVKNTRNDPTRKLKIGAQSATLAYNVFGTFSTGLLVAGLVTTIVFPPAAAVLMATSVVCAGIGFVSLVVSSMLTKVIKKKQAASATKQPIEMHHISDFSRSDDSGKGVQQKQRQDFLFSRDVAKNRTSIYNTTQTPKPNPHDQIDPHNKFRN